MKPWQIGEPKKRKGERPEKYAERLSMFRLEVACKKTGMKGAGRQNRNKKWRIAELERKTLNHPDDVDFSE